MRSLRRFFAVMTCFAAAAALDIAVSAENMPEEFTEQDRMIIGVFPVWAFLLLLAGIVMAAIVIIVEIFKRKLK